VKDDSRSWRNLTMSTKSATGLSNVFASHILGNFINVANNDLTICFSTCMSRIHTQCQVLSIFYKSTKGIPQDTPACIRDVWLYFKDISQASCMCFVTSAMRILASNESKS
jgi:hypothetical protein